MTVDAYICDYVRTPIGRYGGALAERARRRSGGAAHSRTPAPSRGPRWPYRGGCLRLRQPGWRGQPQPGANGLAAGRIAGLDSRRDSQSPLRFGHGRGRRGGARDQVGRDRSRHRGRRGIDDAGAAGHGQGGDRIPALRRSLRHDHRMAVRQPADEKSLWRRFDAGDRADRCGRASGVARGPGRLRAALAGTRSNGPGEWDLRSRDRSGRNQGPQRHSDPLRQRRASESGYNTRCAGEIEGDRAAGRQRDRRQRVRRQRRRGGVDSAPPAKRSRPMPLRRSPECWASRRPASRRA